MDAVDPALVDRATAAIASVDGVEEIRELRIRWIGHSLRAEADVPADPNLTITQAHDLAHHAEDHLLANVGRRLPPMCTSVRSVPIVRRLGDMTALRSMLFFVA